MKNIKIIGPLFLIMLIGSGCVNLNNATLHPQILPQPKSGSATSKSGSNKNVTDFPGIAGVLGNIANSSKTRVIASDNGDSSNVVTIIYEDIATANVLDPGNAIKKTLNLASSLLNCNSGVSTRIYRSDLKGLLSLIQQLNAFQGIQFQTTLNSHINDLLADQLSGYDTNKSNNMVIKLSLDALLATYLKAYLNGLFVDRWGTPVSQPDLAQIGNEAVAPLTKIVLEAVFDYSLMTPIVHDPNQASTNKTPTFAVIFPQLYEDISTNSDARGITEAEYNLIKSFSQTGGEINNLLSSLLIKAFGGASFGIKLSTGDNSTLSQILSTLCAELSSRTIEEISYDFLEKFRYSSTTTNYYTENNINLFPMLDPVQDGVILMLRDQTTLNELIQNGWKVSGSNITNYTAVAQSIITTNSGILPLQVDANLFQLIQGISQNKGNLSMAQQQALIGAIDQMVQSFEANSTAIGTNAIANP